MKYGSAIIGTFHKTGTNLFQAILRAARRRLGIQFWQMHHSDEPDKWDVAFDDHSRFIPSALERPHRGVLIIRDPRDVIISAARYHCRSTEPWLHVPRGDFGGLTYQQKINSLQGWDERFRFEMDYSAGRTIRSMVRAVRAYPGFRTFRFEDLVTDTELTTFREIFTYLGFEDHHLERLLKIAYKNSLFSNKVPASDHISSGAPAQWREVFSPELLEECTSRFKRQIKLLGYKPQLKRSNQVQPVG